MSNDAEIARCNQRISTTNSQISSTEFKYRIDDNLDRINNKVNLAEALSKLLGNEKFLATIAKDSNVDDFFWKVMTKLDDMEDIPKVFSDLVKSVKKNFLVITDIFQLSSF